MNGKIEQILVPENVNTLDDCSRLIPDGVYTTFRTYEGNKIFRYSDHIKRLEQSSLLIGERVIITEKEISQILRIAINNQDKTDFRIRLTITFENHQPILFVSISPFTPPSDSVYKVGVKVKTIELERQDPLAKKTDFISSSTDYRKGVGGEIHELIMVDKHGFLLEGLTSNFYGALNGSIYTAGEGVLSGITQKIILEEAEKAGISVYRKALHQSQILSLNESFITSSGRAVIPVVAIDDITIGKGMPGPISELLLKAYQERISGELYDFSITTHNSIN